MSYDSDSQQVLTCIKSVVGAHPKALFTPEPFVRMSGLKDSCIEYTLRVWCATEDYWDLYFDLLEQVKASFDQHGIEIPYNQLDVRIVERKEKQA